MTIKKCLYINRKDIIKYTNFHSIIPPFCKKFQKSNMLFLDTLFSAEYSNLFHSPWCAQFFLFKM